MREMKKQDRYLIVSFVRADGTYTRDGIRVRAAPGVGPGSLHDEVERGERTPVVEDVREQLIRAARTKTAREFVEALPIARTE